MAAGKGGGWSPEGNNPSKGAFKGFIGKRQERRIGSSLGLLPPNRREGQELVEAIQGDLGNMNRFMEKGGNGAYGLEDDWYYGGGWYEEPIPEDTNVCPCMS